jgi:hypothetical protein
LDTTRIGDPDAPPRSTSDPEILLWAESEGRVLVSRDKSTLPNHLIEHLAQGHHSPGIFIVRTRPRIGEVIELLVLAAYASDSEEWRDRIEFLG